MKDREFDDFKNNSWHAWLSIADFVTNIQTFHLLLQNDTCSVKAR